MLITTYSSSFLYNYLDNVKPDVSLFYFFNLLAVDFKRFIKWRITKFLDSSGDSCDLTNAALEEENIRVRGEYPVYEIFPFIVKILSKEGFALINNRTYAEK